MPFLEISASVSGSDVNYHYKTTQAVIEMYTELGGVQTTGLAEPQGKTVIPYRKPELIQAGIITRVRIRGSKESNGKTNYYYKDIYVATSKLGTVRGSSSGIIGKKAKFSTGGTTPESLTIDKVLVPRKESMYAA